VGGGGGAVSAGGHGAAVATGKNGGRNSHQALLTTCVGSIGELVNASMGP